MLYNNSMDPTTPIDLTDLFNKLDSSTNEIRQDDGHTVYGSYSDPYFGAVPSANITISSPNVYSNSSPYTISATGGPYTINSGAGTGINSPWYSTSVGAKIRLDGEGADIEVNGWSLVSAIKQIEERLNILTPNAELEKEWEELKALGEQYRKLEQHIRDKQATWDRLKAMPPPVVE
jgi:hypothetical protein